MNIDPQLIIKINQTVDQIHSFFPTLALFGCFFLIESYLPKKSFFESSLDKFLSYFKLSLVSLLAFIFLSQGILGGCLLHIPQNFLSQKYLSRNWSNYGLVFREKIPRNYLPLLRTSYLGIGLYASWASLKFYEKRIIFKNINIPELKNKKTENLETIS